jgi:hypothetical protein
MIPYKDTDPVLIANISGTKARLKISEAYEKYKDEWDISPFKLQRWVNQGKIEVDKASKPRQPSLIHEDSLLQYLKANVARKKAPQIQTDLLIVYENRITELQQEVSEYKELYNNQVQLNIAMIRDIPSVIQNNVSGLIQQILEMKENQQKLLESTQTKRKWWQL